MPRPKGIVCNICGGEFFKRSFAIHQKQCKKKFESCHEKCEWCGHYIELGDMTHKAACKKRAKGKKYVAPKKKAPTTSAAGGPGGGSGDGDRRGKNIEKESRAEFEAEDGEDCAYLDLYGTTADSGGMDDLLGEGDGREPCAICGRKFFRHRIAKHEAICAKAASKKKKVKVKVGAKLRTKGTEFAQYQGQKRAKTPPHTTTKNTIWRDEHAKLLAIVEAGRQEKRAKELGIPLSEMPDPLDVVKKAIAEGGTGADAPNHLQKVKLWDRVELDDGRKGAVKFMGRVPELESKGQWLGIALDEKKGNHDGAFIMDVMDVQNTLSSKVTRKGKKGKAKVVEREIRYFRCKPGHGIFIRSKRVVRVIPQKKKEKAPSLLDKPVAKASLKPKAVPGAGTSAASAAEKRLQAKAEAEAAREAENKMAAEKTATSEAKATGKATAAEAPASTASSSGYVERLRSEVAKGASPRTTPRTTPRGQGPEQNRPVAAGTGAAAARSARSRAQGKAALAAQKRSRAPGATAKAKVNTQRAAMSSLKSSPSSLGRAAEAGTTSARSRPSSSGSSRSRPGSRNGATTSPGSKENAAPSTRSGAASAAARRAAGDKARAQLSGKTSSRRTTSSYGSKSANDQLTRASGQFKAQQRAKEAQQKLRAEKRAKQRKEMSTKSVAARTKKKGPGFGSGGKTVADDLNEHVFGKQKAKEIARAAGKDRFINSKLDKMNKGARAEELHRRRANKQNTDTLRKINGEGKGIDRKEAANAFRKAGGAGHKLGGSATRGKASSEDPRAARLAALARRGLV